MLNVERERNNAKKKMKRTIIVAIEKCLITALMIGAYVSWLSFSTNEDNMIMSVIFVLPIIITILTFLWER